MRVKIVADSSANLNTLFGVEFTSVPLKIITDVKEYVDDANLDVPGMVADLGAYSGRSGTACPSVGDWINAFDGCDEVYCVTITSVLSGSYNSCMTAKQQYEEENPGKKVFVLDSLTAGGEMKMHVEKIKELVLAGKDFDTICREATDYRDNHTRLVFSLESLRNLANNGRVNPAVAKIAGLIGIRMVGDANGGKLNPHDKSRGEKNALASIYKQMKGLGYKGGLVVVDNCLNPRTSTSLKEMLLAEYPDAVIRIEPTRGLCSFYAEKGGLMIGFEI